VKIKISEIQIPERFRYDYGDLKELGESIGKFGLLQPIVVTMVDGTPTLVAGARRLLACTQIGNGEIDAVLFDDLEPIRRREIELEENIRRKQFTWQEEVRAKAELVEIRKAQGTKGLWAASPQVGKEVARELHESEATLSMDVQLAKAMLENPELAQEESKTKAFKKYKQILQRDAIRIISEAISGGENLWMYNGDCTEEMEKIQTGSVGLVITDPPWGVEVFDVYESDLPQFDDKEEKAFETLEKVLPEIYRVLKNDSHAYFFFGTKHYVRTFKLLSKLSWKVEPIPFIWVKPNAPNTAPQARPTYNYETIFLCRKGCRNFYKPTFAALEFPIPTNKIHPTQKPVKLIQHFIEVSSIPGEVVLDPFAGSGVVAKAALEVKRKAIVIEKDIEIFNAMKVYITKKEEEKGVTITSED
jgi:ParB/RepB/Spo0J family partition protein